MFPGVRIGYNLRFNAHSLSSRFSCTQHTINSSPCDMPADTPQINQLRSTQNSNEPQEEKQTKCNIERLNIKALCTNKRNEGFCHHCTRQMNGYKAPPGCLWQKLQIYTQHPKCGKDLPERLQPLDIHQKTISIHHDFQSVFRRFLAVFLLILNAVHYNKLKL